MNMNDMRASAYMNMAKGTEKKSPENQGENKKVQAFVPPRITKVVTQKPEDLTDIKKTQPEKEKKRV